ncbi:uncharacterized protein LOC111126903 isoform X2 [Crassostrea virginica]
MALMYSTILFWIISPHGLIGHVYQHTTFQRFMSVSTEALNRTSGVTTASATTENACLNICHKQISCLSAVFDETSSQCSMYDTKISGEEVAAKQDYFLVLKKTIHEDVIAYAENLCQGNSSGYIYNATVPLCYKIDTQPRLKTAAESFCGEFGGRLLRINTERKQRFVEDLDLKETASIHKYRVDGLLSGGVWTFSDGTPITDVYWYPGEPAGGGVSIGLRVGHNGKWDDISHVINHGTICEKELSFN